jgi:hypothetical protein
VAVVALALAPAMVVNAADIEVINNNDSGPGSLRQAIIDVGTGDEITFADNVTGTIILTTGQLSISKNLTITGPGAELLTISGNNASRVFHIASGATVTISGLTIANGNAAHGGGIFNEEGVVTLNNCTIRGNHADNVGGGIFNSDGTVTLNNCTVRGNHADNYGGGGIFNDDALIVNGSTISGNDAYEGGGIFNFGVLGVGTATLNNCTVSNNTAVYGNGGGILNGQDSAATLNNCTISGNDAYEGGGICNVGNVTLNTCTVSGNDAFEGGGISNSGALGVGTATLNNCTISGNDAVGGGIFNEEDGAVTLNNCTVSGNTAEAGGGIFNEDGTVTLNNCTISGNDAGDGGGILNEDGNVTLNNCTISGNDAYRGGGIFNFDGTANVKNTIIAGNNASSASDFDGTLTSYGCNLVEDTSGCTITHNETCNIYGEDPLLDPLQDNGGPTFTHALLEGSPAIDGVCADCGCTTIDGALVTTDQRGEPRAADGDGDGTTLCDIGAYEVQPPSSPSPPPPAPPGVPTVNQWGIVAMITLLAGLLVWRMRRKRLAS